MNARLTLSLAIILASASFMTGCSSISLPNWTPSCLVIAPPKINMTGEKTVIERQIVGDYKELEKDAWAVSSVNTNVQKSKGVDSSGGGDKELYVAMKIREFHKDKVDSYKLEGALGEMNTGFVKYMNIPKYDNNAELKNILFSVLKNENDARKVIFTRSIARATKKEATADQVEAFGRQFADEARAGAQKNEWVQDAQGRWVKK